MKKVEMHCHILPGIDDGAEDMKQSLQMLHIAMEHEIVGAIVTPHGLSLIHISEPTRP